MEKDLIIKDNFYPADVNKQVQLIQHVMKTVMKQDTHYGIITGCKKPTLYKAGAEKLLLTFRLATEYKELSVVENNDIISYRIECKILNSQTGLFMGSGIGACNSNEKKYKTRAVYANKATPDEIENALRQETRGGRGEYKVYILKQDPWEIQNTIYKMAAKRALLAATLNVTAASDLFDQDIDKDFVFEEPLNETPPEPKRKSDVKENSKFVNNHQIKRLFTIATKNNYLKEDVKKYYNEVFNINSSKELTKEMYDDICDYIENHPLGV